MTDLDYWTETKQPTANHLIFVSSSVEKVIVNPKLVTLADQMT